MNSKPFIEKEGSPCINCLVRATCSKWCRKLDYFLKKLGVEQIYIKECGKGHQFERPAGDLFFELPKICPHCGQYGGITAARWIYMLKGE